jgi:hypothetical protein
MSQTHTFLIAFLSVAALALLGGCDVQNPGEVNENEVITTVVLTFSPQAGGGALEFRWADPENDGSPVVDDIALSDANDYDLAVRFLNELEDPAEEITDEVDEESDQHQVFFTGTAVDGPASDNAGAPLTQAYADTDVNGLPVGLNDTIVTNAPGSGTFVVTLRHLPPEDDVAVKVAGLAEDVAAGGIDAIGGDTDAEVRFDLVVQ